jgi:hypothetical protein
MSHGTATDLTPPSIQLHNATQVSEDYPPAIELEKSLEALEITKSLKIP